MEDDDDFQIDEELDDDLKDFSSDEDKDYDVEREEDKGEPEDRAHDELLERMDLFESMADVAPPILENDNAPTTITQGQTQRGNTSGKLKIVQKKRKGRGPTKSLRVTCPMHLEYDANGQPCGTWRFKYGTHVGLCLRMISILETWSKVPEGVKDSMWSDTMVSILYLRDYQSLPLVSMLPACHLREDQNSSCELTGYELMLQICCEMM